MRKMSLIEFGWKLFGTAVYCWIVSFFAVGQMYLLGGYLGLRRAFAVVFIASTAGIPVGIILAVTGHIRKYFRRRAANGPLAPNSN
jgi:hypothetical protein